MNNDIQSTEFWISNVDGIVIDKVAEYLEFIIENDSKDTDDGYFEHHHIVPRSVLESLSNSNNNLVKLSGSNHFIAHRLLTNCFIGDNRRKMSFAFHLMCYSRSKDKYNLSESDYAYPRKIMSEAYSGDNNPSKREDVKRKIALGGLKRVGKGNGNYGGLSKKNRESISRSRIENGTAKGSNNPMYGKKGKRCPFYGKIHVNKDGKSIMINPYELDEYLSMGYSKGRGKNSNISKSKTGKIIINNGVVTKMVNPEDLDKYPGFVKGRIKKG